MTTAMPPRTDEPSISLITPERCYNAALQFIGRKLKSVLFGFAVPLAIALYSLSFGVAVQRRWVMHYQVPRGPAVETRDWIISSVYAPIFWHAESDLPGTRQYTAYLEVVLGASPIAPPYQETFEMDDIDGLWRVIAYNDGEVRRAESLDQMARYVFVTTNESNAWRGWFAVVSYGYEGNHWTAADVIEVVRTIIRSSTDFGSSGFKADFYVWAAGRFRTEISRSFNAIDFQQHYLGSDLFAAQPGLYAIQDQRLRLCLSVEGGTRPTAFVPNGRLGQSVSELERVV